MDTSYNPQFSDLLSLLSNRLNKDLNRTERILSDMLHVVRDNLPYDKAMVLYKALPEYMRNFYTSGWNSSDVEKPADHFSELQNQFLKCEMDVREEMQNGEDEIKYFLVNILETLKDLVPGNQLKKVIQALPEDIRDTMLKAVFP